MTGLSLSLCVMDIEAGLVPLDQVDKIIANTMAATPEMVEEVISVYRETYWFRNPDACEAIARRLLAEDKIEQPRLVGGGTNSLVDGHWLDDGVQVRIKR